MLYLLQPIKFKIYKMTQVLVFWTFRCHEEGFSLILFIFMLKFNQHISFSFSGLIDFEKIYYDFFKFIHPYVKNQPLFAPYYSQGSYHGFGD